MGSEGVCGSFYPRVRVVRFITSLVVLLSGAMPVLADERLDAFVTEVLARNPGLRAADLRSNALRTNAQAEGRLPDPNFSLMADRFPDRMAEMPMLRWQVQQMVPWPGKLGLMRVAADEQAIGSVAAAETRKLDVTLQTVQAWWMLAMAVRRLEVNRMAGGLLAGIVRATRARYGAGTGGHHELARAEVEKNANEVERVGMEGERVAAVAMLNALRDRPADTEIEDPVSQETPLHTLDIAKLTAVALGNRPEFREMQAMARQMRAMGDLQRRERYPDLMVGLWWNTMLDGPDTAGAMIGASVPVFGRQTSGLRADAAGLHAQAVEQELAAMRAMVRFQVADAVRKVQTTTRQVAFLRGTGRGRAKESFQSSLAGFATGSAGLTDLLDARRALQVTELALADTVVQRELAIAELERALWGQRQGEAR